MHSIAFRPLTREDLPSVSAWRAQPHVAQWWRDPHALPSVQAKYLPYIDGREPTEVLVIEAGRAPSGFIQRYLISSYPDWVAVLSATGAAGWQAAAGIDYLIGDPALIGKGIGSAAISQFSAMTFARCPVPTRSSSMFCRPTSPPGGRWRRQGSRASGQER